VFISNTPSLSLDDHEIANNSYTGGAQTTSPMKAITIFGRPRRARRTTMVAYSRKQPSVPVVFVWPLVDLFMLDERLAGRTKPVDSIQDPAYNNEERACSAPTTRVARAPIENVHVKVEDHRQPGLVFRHGSLCRSASKP